MDWKRTAARGLGWVTTLPYRAQTRISIGPRLLGNGRLRISGPGRVVFEADVNAWSHAEVNRLITTRPEALIHIGRHARLNGCTIIAAERVDVGADCVLGSCEVRDHLPYSESPADRRHPGPAQPVVIEDNVWIGGQVSVLPGVRIGRDTVVGISGSVKTNPPPPTCDQCKHMPRWERINGPDQSVRLEDGRDVIRRGQVWVCTHCGHQVPVSFEAWT